MLLPEEVRIGERTTCPSLGSPDGVAPDSETRHVLSGGGVPTDTTDVIVEEISFQDFNDDGMPRCHAIVHSVDSLEPFKIRISWLNTKNKSTEMVSVDWVCSGFMKTSEEFQSIGIIGESF